MRKLSFLLILLFSFQAFGYRHHPHKHHHHRGLKKIDRKLLEALPHVSYLRETVSIPNSYSLQPSASPVEDQGQCGSCWDFGLTGALRDTYLALGLPDPGRLSFMYLLDCATDMDGCNGGSLDASRWVTSPLGPPPWSFQPYTGIQGRCKKGPVAASASAVHFIGSSAGPSFKDVAYVISQLHRPLVSVVAADNVFEDYDDGIFDGCDSQQLDHVIIINSYDCEGPCDFDANGNLPGGKGYYGVKNSWSASWGEAGYIRMKATTLNGDRCDGIAAQALYFDVEPAKPSPKPHQKKKAWYCFGRLFCR